VVPPFQPATPILSALNKEKANFRKHIAMQTSKFQIFDLQMSLPEKGRPPFPAATDF